jgi:serine/threonine-protein kinase
MEELVGQGGMAEVYRGYQERLERYVAVKALLPERKDEEAIERFKREALALSALHHENIVAVYDLIEKYGRLYLILEYVDGVDLSEVLKGGPVPLDIGLLVGSALASALEHAHFRRVLHRDIKPGNVMLASNGQIKLTDFGIAKDENREDLTQQGFVVGTLDYLSPEQISGGRADWRSDVYGLGVTLFEIFSGTRPYHADNRSDLLTEIIRGQHRLLRDCVPKMPRSVERLVHCCLELNPAKRYQRAADVRRDLERLLGAVLQGTRSARVMAFLQERELLEELDESLHTEEVEVSRPIASPETALSDSLMRVPVRASPLKILGRYLIALVLVVLLAAVSLAVAYWLAPEWMQKTLADVQSLLVSAARDGALPTP